MENRLERYYPAQIKKARQFLMSSSFALMMTLHPGVPVTWAQESGSSNTAQINPEDTPAEEENPTGSDTNPEPSEEPTPAPATPVPAVLASWTGTATYYSNDGCVGCSPGQIMTNGEKFIDTAMTFAAKKEMPLNCSYDVTNLNNRWQVRARATDRGGFEAYHHIADLSRGLKNAIGGSSVTYVRIALLSCP